MMPNDCLIKVAAASLDSVTISKLNNRKGEGVKPAPNLLFSVLGTAPLCGGSFLFTVAAVINHGARRELSMRLSCDRALRGRASATGSASTQSTRRPSQRGAARRYFSPARGDSGSKCMHTRRRGVSARRCGHSGGTIDRACRTTATRAAGGQTGARCTAPRRGELCCRKPPVRHDTAPPPTVSQRQPHSS